MFGKRKSREAEDALVNNNKINNNFPPTSSLRV